MHDTSDCRDRGGPTRPALAAVLMLALAGLGGLAQAGGFDDKARAPMMIDAAQARAQARDLANRYSEVRAAGPVQLAINALLARERFDMRWQFERAVDERKPLDDFEALGFVSLGEGAYKIDYSEHPEWDDLPAAMVTVLTSDLLATAGPGLIQRGFRPEDVTTLEKYVAATNPQAAAKLSALPIALGFAKVVRKFDKAGRPVPDTLVLSYLYQSARAASEANRLWVADLLKQFDAQRARILVATFLELQGRSEWHPTDPALAINSALNAVRTPNFEELAIAEAKGVAP